MQNLPRIRILMLLENSSFPEDSRVLLQARSLIASGYAVTVIAPTEKGTTRKSELIEGIQVYRYPQAPEFGGILGYSMEYTYSIMMLGILAVYVYLRKGFDTIHMHTPPDMTAVIPAFFRLLGKKFVYDLHDLSPELYLAQRGGVGNRLIHRTLLWFEKFASRNSDMAISTNESQRDTHVDRCQTPLEKFHVVRNGPNAAFLDENIQPQHGVGNPAHVVLGYVGVMGIQDGVDYLIRVLDILVNKRGRTNVSLVLVGSGSAIDSLKHQVQELRLGACTTFTGRIPFAEVPSYIAAFDICCTPDPSNSYNDSCTTIKTMEYMALGKPVVCFETTENMKTAGPSAFYAANNDVQLYADLIEKLIDSPELRQQMGNQGRTRIIEQLSWKHQSRKLVEAYDSLHGIHRKASACDVQAAHVIRTAESSLPASFAFNGRLGQVLAQHLQKDIDSAKLSQKFRLYYSLRRLLPSSFRQHLQRSRNRSMKIADDWFMPNQFLRNLRNAYQSDCAAHQNGSGRGGRSELVIHPWPDGYRFSVALTHDIETQEGMKRVDALAAMEESLGLRSAWFFVPHKYRIDQGLLADLVARGHEVGVHGFNHDGRLFLSQKIFQYRTPYINQAADSFSASGFRAPMMHRNHEWMQALQFEYDASCFDVDPFQPMPGGVGGVWPFLLGEKVELPYTLPQDHTLMVTLGQSAFPTWKRKTELIMQLSGMAMLITHPDYLDSEVRLNDYRNFCEHVASMENAWRALPREIAQWWRSRQATGIDSFGRLTGPASSKGRVVPISEVFEIF